MARSDDDKMKELLNSVQALEKKVDSLEKETQKWTRDFSERLERVEKMAQSLAPYTMISEPKSTRRTETPGGGFITLYHYTSHHGVAGHPPADDDDQEQTEEEETEAAGILKSGIILKSSEETGEYGAGVYMTNIPPARGINLKLLSAQKFYYGDPNDEDPHAVPRSFVEAGNMAYVLTIRIPKHKVRLVDPEHHIWLYPDQDLVIRKEPGVTVLVSSNETPEQIEAAKRKFMTEEDIAEEDRRKRASAEEAARQEQQLRNLTAEKGGPFQTAVDIMERRKRQDEEAEARMAERERQRVEETLNQ